MKPCAAVLLLLVAACQEPAADPPESFQTEVRAAMEKGAIPGLQVALVVDGSLAGTWAFGTGISIETRFNVASVSKPVTASCVVQLAERGVISLDDPVDPLLPDPWLAGIGLDGTTWRELLTHSSGLADVFDTGRCGYGYAWLGPPSNGEFLPAPLPLAELLPRMLVRASGPGPYAYSNDGYALLSFLVERVTHESFEDYAMREVLLPLGMERSRFLRASLPSDWPIAEGHGYPGGADADPLRPWPPYENCTKGDGALWSTAEDLALFLAAQIESAGPAGGKVLSRASAESLRAPLVDDGEGGSQALGFGVADDGWAFHDGSNPGYMAAVAFHAEWRCGYVLLANQDEELRSASRAFERVRRAALAELRARGAIREIGN